METIADFEDLLFLFEQHNVRYLIVGGLAFIYHAKPRYTKDMDIWVDPDEENIKLANRALAEFPSPNLLSYGQLNEILQIGIEPNRVDILQQLGDADFTKAWQKKIRDRYGNVACNWASLDTLIAIKSAINEPRHQNDAQVLREVLRLREKNIK
ncbi:MAG: hypothetical protein JW841_13615 [Deltaproteobacteria bacterium]|nr:hypothetical protein [Deltaproteobacteria bacterium]